MLLERLQTIEDDVDGLVIGERVGVAWIYLKRGAAQGAKVLVLAGGGETTCL